MTPRRSAQCSKCKGWIPYSNPRAATQAMRRHRKKFHPKYKGKLSYRVFCNSCSKPMDECQCSPIARNINEA